jgi:hypothetical protein
VVPPSGAASNVNGSSSMLHAALPPEDEPELEPPIVEGPDGAPLLPELDELPDDELLPPPVLAPLPSP